MQINLLYTFRRLGHGYIALDMFFKNAKMVSVCHHILDFSQNHLKTFGKSLMKKLLWKCQGKNIKIWKCNKSSRQKGFCGSFGGERLMLYDIYRRYARCLEKFFVWLLLTVHTLCLLVIFFLKGASSLGCSVIAEHLLELFCKTLSTLIRK